MPQHTDRTPFLVAAIRQLDSGVNAHTRWLGSLHQSLVCGTPPAGSATATDAHQICAFGRWFYANDPAEWQRWEAELADIGELHRTMHDLARGLFERHDHGPVPVPDYSAFLESSIRFKSAVRALEFRIIQEVCLVDHLTGVWNRSSMFQRLAEEHQRMLRSGQPCCLCMMDLDHFKTVNDTHGHIAGDEVLQAVVAMAGKRLRAYDSMFRYGGEEFLFCLPDMAIDDAQAAMERIRRDIEAAAIPLKSGQSLRVTASFGIAALSDLLSEEESVEQADRALLIAKACGRNRVCRLDPA